MTESTKVRIKKAKFKLIQERGKPFKRSGEAELDYILDQVLFTDKGVENLGKKA